MESLKIFKLFQLFLHFLGHLLGGTNVTPRGPLHDIFRGGIIPVRGCAPDHGRAVQGNGWRPMWSSLMILMDTLQATNISPNKWDFESMIFRTSKKVGYVSSVEGMWFKTWGVSNKVLVDICWWKVMILMIVESNCCFKKGPDTRIQSVT